MNAPVLILGATGSVGRGLVAAAVAVGRAVIAVSRDKPGLQQLRTDFPTADLTALPGSVASDAQGARLAKAVERLGRPLSGVMVAVCGGGGRGRLLDQPANALRDSLHDDLLPHLVAARHLLPLLVASQRGGYVLIGGPGGEQPWAGYGCRSINAAALRMLARVLHDEARAHAVRVQLLLVDTPVRSDANRGHACPQWPSAFAVGERALALVDHADTHERARAIVRYSASPAALSDKPSNDADTQRCLSDARVLLDSMNLKTHPEASPR